MSTTEWKEATRAEAITALDAGTHDVERFGQIAWVTLTKSGRDFGLNDEYRIRAKREYRVIRIPLGVKEAPRNHAECFYLAPMEERGYLDLRWDGNEWQLKALSRRAIYTDEAVVKEAVAAMWGTE